MGNGATLVARRGTDLGIVGELHLNGTDYLIINLDIEINQSQLVDVASFIEILRFELQGQVCAILESGQLNISTEQTENSLPDILTERELQIATLVAMGRLNKQIADKLHISEWTVSTHLRRIFAKLGVRSRAAMVYRCAPLIEPS